MKPWAYALIIFAVIAAFGTTYKFGKDAGYDKREAEIQEHNKQVRENQEKIDAQDQIDTNEAAEATIVYQDRIVTEIEYVDREIETVVKEIEFVTPECADLGDDFAGLLNKQVRAANGEFMQTPEPAPDVDTGMP